MTENNEQGKIAEEETKPLGTEEQVVIRQREKGEVTKPVKKRPKSEGYEVFEREGYVIGLVSVSCLRQVSVGDGRKVIVMNFFYQFPLFQLVTNEKYFL